MSPYRKPGVCPPEPSSELASKQEALARRIWVAFLWGLLAFDRALIDIARGVFTLGKLAFYGTCFWIIVDFLFFRRT